MSTLHDRICQVSGCVEMIRCKGFCSMHYNRHLRGLAMDLPKFIPRVGPCLVPECDAPRRSRGLCGRHYDRGRRKTTCPACGTTMQVASTLCVDCYRKAAQAHIPAEKTCAQCGVEKPLDAFGLRLSGQGAARWRSMCRECAATDARLRVPGAHRDRSKERLSAPYLGLRAYARKLGIPWREVVDRYPVDNRCEICGRTPQEANPGGRFVRLALDHCHETGALRGFLCGPCNTGLGSLGDTYERVHAALTYLVMKRDA